MGRGSPDRMGELLRWSRDTLQPKYGIPYGVCYAAAEGTAELYDYWWFFAPFDPKLDAQAARMLGKKPGDRVVLHPRGGVDLWNARYFLMPVHHGGWQSEHRSYLAFVTDSRLLFPKFLSDRGPVADKAMAAWLENHDWQLFRNEAAYPRAWVVHKASFSQTVEGLRKADRSKVMTEILYEENPFWHEPRTPIDPHEHAWIETDDRSQVAPFATGGAPDRSETIRFDRYEPTRVELTARLARPGFVILADVYYPGWRLTIDGVPATILKANRADARGGRAVGDAHARLHL